MLKFVKMEKIYVPLLNDMMDEWTQTAEKIIPWSIRKWDYHDIDGYMNSLEVREAFGKYVPDSTFFCLDTERRIFVGAVNIRHYLNDSLLIGGGHIGSGVRPSERGKGYGTKMLALAVEECRRLGIANILVCCDKSNTASARTIVKNGGILENEIVDDGVPVQRYWIYSSTEKDRVL